MYNFNNDNSDLFSKYGLQGGNYGTTATANKPPVSAGGQKPVLANPMAFNNTSNPKGGKNDSESQYGFRDNDFRVNFNINQFDPNSRSNFKDSFSGFSNPLSGFPTSSSKLDYYPTSGFTSNYRVPSYQPATTTPIANPMSGVVQPKNYGYTPSQPAYKPPTNTYIPPAQTNYGNYGTSSYGGYNAGGYGGYGGYGTGGYGYGGNVNPPSTANLDPVVKVVDQYQPPPIIKPSPVIDNNQQKQIADIMKNNSDVDKTKMMDMANLGKVIYGAALSSSATSQKYTSLLNDLKASKKKFTDSDFPPDKSSLAPPSSQGEYRDVVAWKRATEIFKNPQLFEGKIEPNDIMQGNLGDCYLLSTFAAIAEDSSRIQKMFISTNTSPEGIYAVDLTWRGANIQVILDDYIPVDKKGDPYFLKSKNNELWVILLEKAWAKLHHNYHRLDGQLTKETLHDYTGAPTRSFRTNRDQDQLWNKMVEADQKGYIMTTGTEGDDCGAGDPLRKFGLVSGHAYTLIGASNVKLNNGETVKLVQVRNPWGEFEWTGKWSDKDSIWNNVSPSEKSRIGFTVEDDGTFFLEYKNMLEYFDGVQICYYNQNYNYVGQLFRTSYKDAKYFEVKIPTSGNYYFNIGQMSIRCFDEDYQDNPNSHYSDTKFCIINQSGQIQQAYSGRKRDLYSPKYIDTPKQFQAGTYYAYVRVQWQRSATHQFGFGAYGPGKIEIKEIQPSQAGNLASQVQPWDQGSYPSFDIEQIALI